MDLTAEERAVLAKVCGQVGHTFDLSHLINPIEDGQTLTIRAGDADTLPHVACTRCFHVWLVVAEGDTYEAAEQALNNRLAPEHRITSRAEIRAARLAAMLAEQEAKRQVEAQVLDAPAPTGGTVDAAPQLPVAVPGATDRGPGGGHEW